MVECSWERHDYSNEGSNDGEYNRAKRVIGESIENLRSGKDVESDKHDIISEKHTTAEPICDSVLSKDVVSTWKLVSPPPYNDSGTLTQSHRYPLSGDSS